MVAASVKKRGLRSAAKKPVAAAGRFGVYGGRYVPETLMAALEELEREYERAKHDRKFQQRLAQAVVDLVRARVQQVFALDINARAAKFFGKPFGEIEWRGTAGVVVQQVVKLRLKCRIPLRRFVGVPQFFDGIHQHFRHVPAAVWTEVPLRIWG